MSLACQSVLILYQQPILRVCLSVLKCSGKLWLINYHGTVGAALVEGDTSVILNQKHVINN